MNELDQRIMEELKKWNVEYLYDYKNDITRQRVLDMLTNPGLKNVVRTPEGIQFTS